MKFLHYRLSIPRPANMLVGIGHLGGAWGLVNSVVVIAGYKLGHPEWGRWAGDTTMALSTATIVLGLSVAALCVTTALHAHLTICHGKDPNGKS